MLAAPARAATGDPLALGLFALVAILAFVVVAHVLGIAFTRGLAQVAAEPASRASARRRSAFRTGPGPSLRRKEWRLLRRDPWLASQLLLQAAYTLPLCFVLWQTLGPHQGPVAAISPALVVIAAQAAGALAWITLSTEDAPELLATAPLTRGAVERAKLTAVAIPLGAVLGVPLLAMAASAPLAAITTFAFATVAAASTALLNLWRQAPAKRGDILRRQGQPKLLGILEHALALCWAVSIALFTAGSSLFLAPAAIAIILLLTTRPSHRPLD